MMEKTVLEIEMSQEPAWVSYAKEVIPGERRQEEAKGEEGEGEAKMRKRCLGDLGVRRAMRRVEGRMVKGGFGMGLCFTIWRQAPAGAPDATLDITIS